MRTNIMQLFNFKIPVLIEHRDESGSEIIARSDREEIIIRTDDESLTQDLPELCAQAKLAELDPLLITSLSQSNPTDDELRYLGMFHELTAPLRDAWVWSMLRKHAPNIYATEIAEILQMWESVGAGLITPVHIDDKTRRQTLGLWAILTEDPANKIDLKITGDPETLPLWERYIAVIREFIPQSPDPELYTLLPDAADAPYRVRIKNEGKMRYFEVKEK